MSQELRLMFVKVRIHFETVVRPVAQPGVKWKQRVTDNADNTIRYDTRCYFNVRSKADMSQLNLSHGNDN